MHLKPKLFETTRNGTTLMEDNLMLVELKYLHRYLREDSNKSTADDYCVNQKITAK